MDEVRIEDLVEAGILALEAEEAARQKAARQEGREQAAELEQERGALLAAARGALPEVLHPFLALPEETGLDEWTRSWSVSIEVPGCAAMWACFARAPVGAPEREWMWDGEYNVYGEPVVVPAYEVGEVPTVDFCRGHAYAAKELRLALGESALVYERARRLEEGLEDERRERLERAAAAHARQAEQEQARLEEQAELLRELDGDPVAMALLRVFLAVRADRWSLQEQALEGWRE